MFQSQCFWFSYQLGVEEDGDEGDEVVVDIAIFSMLLVVVLLLLTAMVLMLMLMMFVLSAFEGPIFGTESMD